MRPSATEAVPAGAPFRSWKGPLACAMGAISLVMPRPPHLQGAAALALLRRPGQAARSVRRGRRFAGRLRRVAHRGASVPPAGGRKSRSSRRRTTWQWPCARCQPLPSCGACPERIVSAGFRSSAKLGERRSLMFSGVWHDARPWQSRWSPLRQLPLQSAWQSLNHRSYSCLRPSSGFLGWHG